MTNIMPDHIGKKGLDLIRHFEGFQPKEYACPAGKPTIGYGHVLRDGEKFPEGISIGEATDLLKKDLQFVENVLHATVKVPLISSQFDALASFIYNVGSGNWEKSSFLKRLNNREDLYEISSEFLKFVYVGSKRMRGLMIRREAERNLFNESVIN